MYWQSAGGVFAALAMSESILAPVSECKKMLAHWILGIEQLHWCVPAEEDTWPWCHFWLLRGLWRTWPWLALSKHSGKESRHSEWSTSSFLVRLRHFWCLSIISSLLTMDCQRWNPVFLFHVYSSVEMSPWTIHNEPKTNNRRASLPCFLVWVLTNFPDVFTA